MRQRVICTFCHEVIIETHWPFYDVEGVERQTRTHLTERHPIRWRFHSKFRRAIQQRHPWPL